MKRVLVIDDDKGVRKSIEIGLRGAGYSVTTAGTYEDGFGLATSQSFDIILCDLKLPDRSGIDVIKDLKKNNIAIPVVTISGFIDSTMVKDAKDAGAVAYLPKPFLKKQLLDLLKSIVPGEG